MCLLCVGYRPTMGEAVYLHAKTNISQLLWPLLVTTSTGLRRWLKIIWWCFCFKQNKSQTLLSPNFIVSPCKIWHTFFFFHVMFTKAFGQRYPICLCIHSHFHYTLTFSCTSVLLTETIKQNLSTSYSTNQKPPDVRRTSHHFKL